MSKLVETLTQERLREVLDYDPETGVFRWKIQASSRVRPGQRAGCGRPDGYRAIRVDGVTHTAHRLAWLYVYGVFPKEHTDHINGVRGDDRIANLRDVSHAVNLQNQRRAVRTNKVGLLGVSLTKGGRYFRATIRIRGVLTFLGHFRTKEEAHAAYVNAKRAYHEGCTL